MSLLGYSWLVQELGLKPRPLVVRSMLGTRLRTVQEADGSLQHEYPQHYAPAPDVAGHLGFALKHEGVELALLRAVFRACGPGPIEAAIRASPTGRYSRLMGFYYEFTTSRTLDPDLQIGGNYVDALDPERYLTSSPAGRNRRWRVRHNLLGDPGYCPMIRRTPALLESLAQPLQEEMAGLLREIPPALVERASNYLYLKETRSTFGIEHEPMPPADRAARFIRLLHSAGEGPLLDLLSEEDLVRRQNLIVDPRYAVTHFRDNQNYVGEQRPDYTQRIHYACPPPSLVADLMKGLSLSTLTNLKQPPLVQAALLAFGFVFIHPFEDGNGRLHRFLIHDILHRLGFTPPGVMLPVSAVLLAHRRDYDAALERYSRPLMEWLLEYELDQAGRLTVTNPDDVEGYYRYPDLTAQTEYLARTVALAIREDLAEELRFLRRYDAARAALQELVDMPDRRLDLLMRLLHQNQGRLSQAKRGLFAEITDGELEAMEGRFADAFELGAG